MFSIYKCCSCVSRYYAVSAGMTIKCPACDSKERKHVGDMEAIELVNKLILWMRPDEMEQIFPKS